MVKTVAQVLFHKAFLQLRHRIHKGGNILQHMSMRQITQPGNIKQTNIVAGFRTVTFLDNPVKQLAQSSTQFKLYLNVGPQSKILRQKLQRPDG